MTGPHPGSNDLSRLEDKLRASLSILKDGPSLAMLREMLTDAQSLADSLNTNTLARQRALTIAAKIRLLVLRAEGRA